MQRLWRWLLILSLVPGCARCHRADEPIVFAPALPGPYAQVFASFPRNAAVVGSFQVGPMERARRWIPGFGWGAYEWMKAFGCPDSPSVTMASCATPLGLDLSRPVLFALVPGQGRQAADTVSGLAAQAERAGAVSPEEMAAVVPALDATLPNGGVWWVPIAPGADPAALRTRVRLALGRGVHACAEPADCPEFQGSPPSFYVAEPDADAVAVWFEPGAIRVYWLEAVRDRSFGARGLAALHGAPAGPPLASEPLAVDALFSAAFDAESLASWHMTDRSSSEARNLDSAQDGPVFAQVRLTNVRDVHDRFQAAARLVRPAGVRGGTLAIRTRDQQEVATLNWAVDEGRLKTVALEGTRCFPSLDRAKEGLVRPFLAAFADVPGDYPAGFSASSDCDKLEDVCTAIALAGQWPRLTDSYVNRTLSDEPARTCVGVSAGRLALTVEGRLEAWVQGYKAPHESWRDMTE